jgi:glycosidase
MNNNNSMQLKSAFSFLLLMIAVWGCQTTQNNKPETTENGKIVIYQVFTRLFGNKDTTMVPWGTVDQNGVGKFNDFTDKALQEIKLLGVTHIWYTGVPHHAVINDYTAFGISNDDPDVVKGRAGSPYAVKDYYNVDPDLAVNPAKRMEEFLALIERSHRNGLKVIIDIVPNHVARGYHSISNPDSTEDFGAGDNKNSEYQLNNNFYYIPGKQFLVPDPENNYKPLGGELNPLADGKFDENPAKWTGNGNRSPKPGFYDWYETVKINFGVRPDGTRDFDTLSEEFDSMPVSEHFTFWKDKNVPSTWIKFRDIVWFWLDKGVDGFRFDMAEMVPVAFWSFLNSAIKNKNPSTLLLAEVYNPSLYRDYIRLGKMDYLYDKVELYDTLKHFIQGKGSTDHLVALQEGLSDIEHHMLHFLENHDEQRIASPEFAGNPVFAKPAMVLSATISTSPTMIYFGQEVGEPGAGDAGFGTHSRTSIFDYTGVPHHQRWMNGGSFDGGSLTPDERELRDFYSRLLNVTVTSPALNGYYKEIHSANHLNSPGYDNTVFSFIRGSKDEKLLIICNFDRTRSKQFDLQLQEEIVRALNLKDGKYLLTDQLYGSENELKVTSAKGKVNIKLKPLESFIYRLE